MNINKLKLLKKVLKEEKYDSIYELFGKKIYNLVVPIKHKRKDINKLLENKDISTLYKKYGTGNKIYIRNYSKRLKKINKEIVYLCLHKIKEKNHQIKQNQLILKN